MDVNVLQPELVRIGGRCYRNYTGTAGRHHEKHQQYYQEEEEFDDRDVYNDEICDVNIDLEHTGTGYRIKMNIPSVYFRFIIGKKGETKRRLEYETKTQIRIPKQGEEGDVVIQGQDRKGVVSAKTRIEVIVESSRQRQQFTHFLSFPVNGQNIKDGFLDFKADVLRECDGDRGIKPAIFQNPDKLHLTIGVMALMNETEVAKATVLLQQCKEDLMRPILKGDPLQVHIEGLEIMNDDPSSVRVLYANVSLRDGSDRLQVLADRVKEKFDLAGLLKKDYKQQVKLHVTLMNTNFLKDDDDGAGIRSQDVREIEKQQQKVQDNKDFDATNVLRLFSDHKFGDYQIDSLHLSKRGAYDETGFYQAAAKINLL